MKKPRALDLFCKAGGASMGLHRAGFDVTGVDIEFQKRYPFTFVQGDATEPPFDLRDFDFIWASPPCQSHTAMKTMHNARAHADLIPATRALLLASGVPYVIENVVGAPLVDPCLLCGSMFGLGAGGAQLRRHRIFEASFDLRPPAQCIHRSPTIGIYGEGCRDSRRKLDKRIPEFTVKHGRIAMDTAWMSLAELCQAIPPAYSKFIGMAALADIAAKRELDKAA